MFKDPHCVEVILQHQDNFLKPGNFRISINGRWLTVQVNGFVEEKWVDSNPDFLPIMYNISLETILRISSFHHKDRSSTGMDALDNRYIVGFFSVVKALEDICHHEALGFSIE